MGTTNPLVLEMATAEDVPAITDIWFASFTQPVIGQLFPDTPSMREWNHSWHSGNIHKPNFRYLRVVDTESKDEEGKPRIVAFAGWDLSTSEERGRRFPPWSPDSPHEACDGLIDGLDKERERVMGDVRHYCEDGAPSPHFWSLRRLLLTSPQTWILLAPFLSISGVEQDPCLSNGAAT